MLASDLRFFHRGFSRPRTLPTLFVASRPSPGFYLHLRYRLLHANVDAVAGITLDVIALQRQGALLQDTVRVYFRCVIFLHAQRSAGSLAYLPFFLATLSPSTPTEARAVIAISCDGRLGEVHPQCANRSSPVSRTTLPQPFVC